VPPISVASLYFFSVHPAYKSGGGQSVGAEPHTFAQPPISECATVKVQAVIPRPVKSCPLTELGTYSLCGENVR